VLQDVPTERRAGLFYRIKDCVSQIDEFPAQGVKATR